MKANLSTIKKYLNSEENILSTLYCVINFGYMSRSGILAATNKKLLFCSDAMFGKGLKYEFEYTEIEDFNHTDGVVLEMSAIPFIKKITMNHGDDFIVFDNFSSPQNVQSFFELVQSKQ
ncbi:PH domain-containing protein [Bacillus wiedmannii]|uniref:PH domain-containing protein n=1 Tax=Bacillus wiedmannii TaxID=1890302 RepID=A0AA95LYF4_9BACI|nr:PH domain-containing protein [Bacillus wiedmannii]WHY31417.1 PH domain-containing protein [Bacillus wiedmannii]